MGAQPLNTGDYRYIQHLNYGVFRGIVCLNFGGSAIADYSDGDCKVRVSNSKFLNSPFRAKKGLNFFN